MLLSGYREEEVLAQKAAVAAAAAALNHAEIQLRDAVLAAPQKGIVLTRARELRPDLAVLFTSGAPGEAGAHLKNLLRKPVPQDMLASAVRRQLDARSRRTSQPNT